MKVYADALALLLGGAMLHILTELFSLAAGMAAVVGLLALLSSAVELVALFKLRSRNEQFFYAFFLLLSQLVLGVVLSFIDSFSAQIVVILLEWITMFFLFRGLSVMAEEASAEKHAAWLRRYVPAYIALNLVGVFLTMAYARAEAQAIIGLVLLAIRAVLLWRSRSIEVAYQQSCGQDKRQSPQP